MSRRALPCVVFCLAASLSLAVSAIAAPSGTGRHHALPAIRQAALGLPVFSGTRFHPGSRVTITLVNGERRHVRTVRVSRLGAFTVRFTLVAVDPCRGTLSVTAVDRQGARARWERECRPPSITDPYPA